MDASKTLKTSSTDGRITQFSVLRAAACLAIVVLHTVFAAHEYFMDSVTVPQDVVSRVVENNMMWAVPVFLMVTGALHLDARKKLTLRKLYGKYVKRIFCALLVFSLLFRIFDMVMDGESFTPAGVLKAFSELLASKGWGHLWYLYLLIGLYVLLPFYKKIAETCTDRDLTYLAAVYIVFTSLIPLIEGFKIPVGFYISESIIYPLYLLAGHMLTEKRWVLPRRAAVLFTVLSTAALSILTVLNSTGTAAVPKVVFGYSSPLVILQSAGVFSLVTGLGEVSPSLRRWLTSADKNSFGIYLIHMVFVRLVFRYLRLNPYLAAAPLTMTVCILCFFLLSWLCTFGLKKLPGIKEIL